MPDRPVTVRLPSTTIDHLMALAIVDDDSLAAQLKKGIGQYVRGRLDDPALDAQLEAAENRRHTRLAALTQP